MGIHNLDTKTATAYMITTVFLATALIASTAVFITVIAFMLRRSKAQTKAALELSNRSTHDEPVYEDVTSPLPSVSVINTQDNVAYGHTKTSISATCM